MGSSHAQPISLLLDGAHVPFLLSLHGQWSLTTPPFLSAGWVVLGNAPSHPQNQIKLLSPAGLLGPSCPSALLCTASLAPRRWAGVEVGYHWSRWSCCMVPNWWSLIVGKTVLRVVAGCSPLKWKSIWSGVLQRSVLSLLLTWYFPSRYLDDRKENIFKFTENTKSGVLRGQNLNSK